MDDLSTVTEIGNTGLHALEGLEGWCITIMHHPNSKFLGRRVLVDTGKHLLMGRDESHFGEGGLHEKRVSRQHARLWVTEGGKAKIEDLESRNGTKVNGQTTQSCDLQSQDIVTIGGIHLLVHRAPGVYRSHKHSSLIGESHGISRVIDDIHKVAPHDTTVLVLGETGTGKELVAKAIHEASGVRGGFFAVNCGGMADTLLQSELFGHVRGAFSGAERERQGLIEAAHGGTLFLDEIGDASPSLQVSLLRFLQEGEIRKLGSNRSIKVKTRVIAATHRDLRNIEGEQSFREDLYARLSRWEIKVPPLRERKEDIPLLIRHFLERLAPGKTLHHRLALEMAQYSWPRNVRELEMIVERALIEAGDENPIPLTTSLLEQLKETAESETEELATRQSTKTSKDPEKLQQLLSKYEGNVRLVSKELGVARNTLYRWFKSFDIDPESFRQDS